MDKYLIGAAAIVTVIVIALVYYKGEVAGSADVKVKNMHATVKIREKQNEIRNNRPDTAAHIDELYRGDF